MGFERVVPIRDNLYIKSGFNSSYTSTNINKTIGGDSDKLNNITLGASAWMIKDYDWLKTQIGAGVEHYGFGAFELGGEGELEWRYKLKSVCEKRGL